MATSNRINGSTEPQFLTTTVTGWVDLFTRPIYKDCLVDSLNYCIVNKGLHVHAFVIMTNHVHLIASAEEAIDLASIIHDFKSFTSRTLLKLIQDTSESRRVWMLRKFAHMAKLNGRSEGHALWQSYYHSRDIFSHKFMMQKLNYIHKNPVRAGIVLRPEDYVYSSAVDYAGGKVLVKIDRLF